MHPVIRRWGLVFLWSLAGLVARPATAEDPAFVSAFRDVQTGLAEVQRIFQKPSRDADDTKRLADLSRNGILRIADVIDGLKEQIEKSLAAMHGTSAPQAPPDPIFPFRFDQNTPTLMRGFVMQGAPQHVVTIFEMCALNVRLVGDWLNLAHAAAVAKGEPRLPYGDYKTIRLQLKNALGTLARFFPQLPKFPASVPDREGKLQLDMGQFSDFYAFFAVQGQAQPPEEARTMLGRLITMIDNASQTVDMYHRFYPQKSNDDGLKHLAVTLMELPGAQDCVNLTRGKGGISDFEGTPCQPKVFKDALVKYIDFYERNVGTSTALMSSLLDLLSDFKEENGDIPADDKFTQFKGFLDTYIQRSRFHARVKEKWPRVRDQIFADLPKLRELLHDGAKLGAFLKGIIDREGLTPRQGFDGDYLENIESAKALLRTFGEQRLDKGPDRLDRVTVTSACKPYLDGETKDSPWTVNTLVAAESETGNGPAVRTEPSANGYRRLVWGTEAKVGNAVAIQNTVLPDKMLAGLSIYMSMRLIVPNIVYSKLLLGQSPGTTLEGIGLEKPENSDALRMVGSHYRLPQWGTIIEATKGAYEDMLVAHARETDEKGNWQDAAVRESVEAKFRAKFRSDMAEGAEQIRAINAMLDTVKDNAARVADPAIATILQIDTAYTGEFDRREAARINESLIKVFLPTIIQEYIYRKWPDSRNNRDTYAEKYNQLKSTFTIDQFMDQMEWYAWPDYNEGSRLRWELVRSGEIGPREPPYSGPFRKPGTFSGSRVPIMGVEEFKLLYRYPILCARLLNHTMDSYQRKLDYLEYAQKRLYYRFPQLKFEDTWKSYDDTKYAVTMQAFITNAVREANKIIALKTPKEILDYFVPNLPLMNIVLRYHPDQKLQLCKEQKDRKEWDDRLDTVLATASMGGAAISMVPVLAPVGLVVDGVVLVVDGVRAYNKYQEMAQAERIMFAGSTQVDFETSEETQYYLREMEGVYGRALARFAIDVAAAVPTVVMNIPNYAKFPAWFTRTSNGLRRAFGALRAEYQAARAAEQAVAKAAISAADEALWFTKSQTRLARALDILNRLRHKMMSPFVKLGLAERWTHKTFFQRFYLNWSFKRAHRLLLNVPGAAKDIFLHFPWSIMGYQWGNGLLAQGLQFYFTYELALWAVHSIQGVSEASTELVMERVHQNPELYGDMVDAMYDGQYRQADLVAMIEIDDKLGVEYRRRSSELMGEFQKALTPEERRAALQNFTRMDDELGKQIQDEENKENFDPNKARILRRTRRHVKRVMNGLAALAR